MASIRRRSNEEFLFAHPGQVLSTDLTNEILSQISRLQLDRLSPDGWERAGKFIADCIVSGDLHSLCLYDPDVLDLTAADQYRIRQCLAFFSKRADIDLGLDRSAAASRKFWEAERICGTMNARFRAHSRGRFFEPRVEAVLHMARRKIEEVLWDAPSMDVLKPRFGPGASTQVPKKNACLATKLAQVPACSTNLADHLEEVAPFAIAGDAGLAEEFLDFPVHLSKLSFVPKNAKTDRAICTEPQLNSQFQLAIGDLIAYRLKRATGIDIRDQSANQRAAQYGSISGGLATLDLSAASDSISLGLCEHLLTTEWFDLLMRFRTAEMITTDSRVHYLQKISSMGNGFTFPLETLIFWAISKSAVEVEAPSNRRRVLVYGDDIIVPTEASAFVVECLETLGFTINTEKSFVDGTFRESCGADFVLGVNVRPIFVKGPLSLLDVMVLHNGLAGLAWDNTSALDYLVSIVHPSIRLFGPSGLGDGHFVSNSYDREIAERHRKKGWGGITFETFQLRPKLLGGALRRKFHDKRGDWHQQCYAHVRRIATYMCEHSAYADDSIRHYLDSRPIGYLSSRVENTLERAFTVPGDSGVKRTLIYIFEPPVPN